MLRTLRGRFALSHMLPLLVTIPLMGIALIYTLETQVLLPTLARELTGQAALVADAARNSPDLWSDPIRAQAFVAHTAPRLDARLMLLDRGGQLLASSDPADVERLGQRLEPPGLSQVLSGETFVHQNYSQQLQAEIADVLMPVAGEDGSVVGIVRLSYRLTGVYRQFLILRYLILGILAGGAVLGAIVGWALALNLERPLRQVSEAIHQLVRGEQLTLLPEPGVAELNLLVRAFNRAVERLHNLEAARRHLLANLVHELGRPLGALRSAIQAFQGGADRDPTLRRDLLDGIEAELRRLQRLLDDLAHLHDQVLGTLELDRRTVNVSEWLPSVLTPWREAAQSKGLHWQAIASFDLPILEIDPDRMAQAVGNLLSNAIKYTPTGGTVAVETGVEHETAWLRVSDTGPGIASEEQTRIFEPFYRGQGLRRFPQGLGLGLTIARDLVTAHGGRLELDSAPGLGSRFTIHLPLNTRHNQSESQGADSA